MSDRVRWCNACQKSVPVGHHKNDCPWKGDSGNKLKDLENRIAIRDKLLTQLGEKYDELEILYSSSSEEQIADLQKKLANEIEQNIALKKKLAETAKDTALLDFVERHKLLDWVLWCVEITHEGVDIFGLNHVPADAPEDYTATTIREALQKALDDEK